MPDLDRLQRLMCSAVRGRHEPELDDLIEGGGLQPEARLRIYRNHAILTLTEALKATFPVVCRLVDERFFGYAAHRYIGVNPPSHPCLSEYGESFADFLATFPACRELVYLADVARLEWAINRALHAAAADAADRSVLRTSDPVLMLHPSLQLVASRWPIERIWRANQPDGNNDEAINLDAGGARLLVFRRDDRVVIIGIEESAYAFLDGIAHGARLEEAIRAAMRIALSCNSAATLDLLFAEGLIVGVQ
jgi:hypothetical protein